MVDRAGRVAVHTGTRCIDHAGHALGNQVSAQANIMERDDGPGRDGRGYRGRARRAAPSGCSPRSTRPRARAATCAAASRPRCSWWRPAAAAGPARRSSSTCASTTMPIRSPSCAACCECGAPTRASTSATSSQPRATSAGRCASTPPLTPREPENPELAFWHGAALAAGGREQEAIPILRKVLRRAPRLARAARAAARRGPLPGRRAPDRPPDRHAGRVGAARAGSRLTLRPCSTTGPDLRQGRRRRQRRRLVPARGARAEGRSRRRRRRPRRRRRCS